VTPNKVKNAPYLGSGLMFGSAVVASVSYFILWFQTFYFGKSTSAILSFKVDDGWCPTPGSGFGAHCWGDYQTPLLGLGMPNQWEEGSAYPPITTIIFKPFAFITNNLQSNRFGLVCYLAAGMAAMLVTIFYAAKRVKSNRLLFMVLFGVLATPIAIAFDRGNLVMFAVPVFFAFAVSVLEKNWNRTVFFVVLATVIKPQFALLVLPMFAWRKWYHIFYALILSLLVHSIGFLLLTNDPVRVFNQWYDFVTVWQSGLIQDGMGGHNFSFVQSIYDWVKIVEEMFLENSTRLSDFLYVHGQSAVYTGVLLLFVAVVFLGKHFSQLGILSCSLALASLVTGISWAYYQVFALVIAGLIVRSDPQPSGVLGEDLLDREIREGSLGRFTGRALITATIATCFNLPIGSDALPFQHTYSGKSVSSAIVAPLWGLVIFLVIKDALRKMYHEKNIDKVNMNA